MKVILQNNQGQVIESKEVSKEYSSYYSIINIVIISKLFTIRLNRFGFKIEFNKSREIIMSKKLDLDER